MNPRYVAFATLTVLSVFFLVPTGNSGMAASAALRVADTLWDASAPIVESADSRSAQSDKSRRRATLDTHDVAASSGSAPTRTSASSTKISDLKHTLLPAIVRPKAAAKSAADVLPDAGTAGGDCGQSFPACDGPCVVGGVCRANTVAGGECVCVKNGVPCDQSSPACDGECPLGEICRANIVAGRECVCVQVDVDCGQSQAPECNGLCPNPADICKANPKGGACTCQPPPDEDEACCFEDGRCMNLLPSECRGADGAPRGPGTACQGDGGNNGIDDACEFDTKCEHCGPGQHWIDICPAGHDRLPSGVVVGLDTNGDCLVDRNLVMFGPAEVARGAGSPHSIPTEMVSMKLTGSGAVLRAGAGGGVGPGAPLAASFGKIIEDGGDPSLGDSLFDILFELDLGAGLFVYNQTPLSLTAGILCVSPNRIYSHPRGCLPLFDSPIPGVGNFVANLVTANHDPFGDPLCPLPTFDTRLPCHERQIFDCVGSDQERCMPRIYTNTPAGSERGGFAEVVRCDCFDDTGSCGPVTLSPEGDSLSCEGSCTGTTQRCEIHIDGRSTGAPSIPVFAVGGGAEVTCECPRPEPDPHITIQGTSATFGAPDVPAIPAAFFFDGSDPFVGPVNLVGGPTDTLGQRDGPIVCPGTGFPRLCDPVGVELVQLDLRSADPIVVGGPGPTLWHVAVSLSPTGSPPLGTLQAQLDHANGGTYNADIPFSPRFTFIEAGNPANVRVLDYDLESKPPIIINFLGVHWVIQLGPNLVGTIDAPNNGNFVPGVRENDPGDPNSQKVIQSLGESKEGGIDHPVQPPPQFCPVDPKFGDCSQLQQRDCEGRDDQLCLPRVVVIVPGGAEADVCACFDPGPGCAPVQIGAGGDTVSCPGSCSSPDERCVLHLADGTSTGAISAPSDQFPVGTRLFCDCALPCQDDTDCTKCERCNLDTGLCVPIPGCCTSQAQCPGCQDCVNGVCVDNQAKCPLAPPLGCQTCVNAVCVDNQEKCNGCEACVNGICEDNQDKCPICEDCLDGVCEPIPGCKACEGKGTPCGDPLLECICETRPDGTLNCADANDFFSGIHGFCPSLSDSECEAQSPGTKCFVNTNPPVCAHNCGKHEDTKCEHCGPGPHWIDTCAAGLDVFPSGAVVGLDIDNDCLVDTNLVFLGPVSVARGAGSPHSIPTEMVSMNLTNVLNPAITLIAGEGLGQPPGLPPSPGAIVEKVDTVTGDSTFDVFFEVHLGAGNYVYNHVALTVQAQILCVPPNKLYTHIPGCLPLFDRPLGVPGRILVANLVTADHQPFPSEAEACCFDDGRCLNLPPGQCIGADGAPRGPGTACQGDGGNNGIDDACEFDTKCEHCGPGPHWIDTCPAGHDRLPSGVVVGLDRNNDCIVDQNLVMFGPAEVARGAGSPHNIPTEMVSMKLTGGGAVLRAGAGGGIGPGSPLGASFGKIIENGGDPSVGDSSFDILFELDLGGGLFAYNLTPLSLTADILCVSPNRIYSHPRGCIPLFDSPIRGAGDFVANLVTANHDPFSEPLCPEPALAPCLPCVDRQIFDCVGSDLQLCLPRVFTNTDGTAEALRCDCFDDDDTCGLVFIGGDGDFFGCDGSCPGAKQLCEIHIDGSSTGADRIPIVDVADGAAVTCDCTCTKSAPPGTDGWATACDGSTSYDFALTPIPADFFALGSAPFADVVALGGATGGLDTQIRRLDSMCFDGPLPVTQTTAIEIVQLDLVSCEKIIVDVGDRTEDWTVFVRLTGTQIQGTLTALKTHDAGGTYTADIPVNAEFLFVRNSDGMTRGPLPAAPTTLSTTVPAPWDQTNCPTGFCPGFTTDPDGGPCCKPTCHRGPEPGHRHCTQPPDCPACSECTYDNGPPLDDFGAPASQYDGFPPEVFSAETADDFFFTGKGTNPCDIEGARFWVTHFNTPVGVVPDPATQWRGVTVSIYDDADPKGPAGNRNDDGGFTTGLVATRTVPMPRVVVIPSILPCLGLIFQIDVAFADPISLEKNHKYWIVFQPNMDRADDPTGGPGYGQVAVLLSQETHDHPAQQIFPLAGLPNWIELFGNEGTNAGCNILPPGSRKDIAFELFAVKSIPCGQTAPVCDGDCPDGSICENVPGADLCSCRSVECAPNAEGTACIGAPCLNQGECNARCVNFNPTTGARSIVDCDCRDAVECHVAPASPDRGTNPCTVVDDGSGTVTLPPQGCEYLSPDDVHMIINGLPPGTTIELGAIHKDFICGDPVGLCSIPLPPGRCEGPGGSLGGSADCFDSVLELSINGTGALSTFSRTVSIPVGCEVHTGPRNPGDAVQTFPNEMFRLQGDLFGDPDFCTLRVVGGRDFGLPSPGQTTLTQLPGGDFNVDSFFDVAYQIDFEGCPGSVLEGVAGTTQATIRMQTGDGIQPPTCVGQCPPGTECERSFTVHADDTVTVCCDCVIPEPVSTFPPHCAIDARQPHPVGPDDNKICGQPKFGWDSLTLQFNVDPTPFDLQPGDFSVQMFPPGVPPVITNVVPDAASQTVLVRFNGPIEPRHWTCVVFTATGRRWCLGYLPADAGQDGLSAASDIGALINSINLVPGLILPPYATDINRSGVTTGSDILRLIDLLNGTGCFDVWITQTLPDCPASHPGPPD